MNYSEKIKTCRENAGLTQKGLAEEIGCSRQIVVRWESGLSVPSMYYAEKLSKRFGITVNSLMSGEDEETPTDKTAETRGGNGNNDVLTTGVFAVLSFVPVALYYVFSDIAEAVRQYLILIGHSLATEYRPVTDLIKRAGCVIGLIFFAVLAALWVNRLIARFIANKDKYHRYVFFKKWNVAFTVMIVNIVVYAFLNYSFISFYTPFLIYVFGLPIALAADGILTYAFYIFAKKSMVFESNPGLNKFNLVFFIMRCLTIGLLVAYSIYAFAVSASAAPMEIAMFLLVFIVNAVVTEAVYFIVRLTVFRK